MRPTKCHSREVGLFPTGLWHPQNLLSTGVMALEQSFKTFKLGFLQTTYMIGSYFFFSHSVSG